MELVNSVPQYAAIIRHCPNIIRAIVSIEADAFDCSTLYRTLCTSRCSTCNRFGHYLYLIDCRRVCYFYFTRRPEYFPLTRHDVYKVFKANETHQNNAKNARELLELTKPPSILSFPARYCSAWTERGGTLQRNRLRLYDRRTTVQNLIGHGLPRLDKATREPKRFMAIITAPILLNGGGQVDWGFFCSGCVAGPDEKTKHFRIKYTKEEISGHIARYGLVVEVSPKYPDRFKHVAKDQIKP